MGSIVGQTLHCSRAKVTVFQAGEKILGHGADPATEQIISAVIHDVDNNEPLSSGLENPILRPKRKPLVQSRHIPTSSADRVFSDPAL